MANYPLRVGSVVTNYLWDEISPYGDVVLETDGSGSTLASYVLGGTELLSQTRGGATSYYLHDGQGSTRALSDDSGAVTDTYAYTAFGELTAQSGTTVNPYLYTGQQCDSLTGLYSLRARYYDPGDGRFLSQDTANLALMAPTEINRYVYVVNNPVNGIDPLGYQSFVEYPKANEQANEQAAEEDSAVAEQGGSLAQDVYDNTIYDSIEDLSAVSSNDSAAFNSTRINLAKTSGHWGEHSLLKAIQTPFLNFSGTLLKETEYLISIICRKILHMKSKQATSLSRRGFPKKSLRM